MRPFLFSPHYLDILNDLGDLFGDDAAVVAGLAARAIGDGAFRKRKEGVIGADAHIFACFDLGAPLADDDHARTRFLAVGELNPEVFRV